MKVVFNNSLDDIVGVYEALLLRQRATGKATKPAKQVSIIVIGYVLITAIA